MGIGTLVCTGLRCPPRNQGPEFIEGPSASAQGVLVPTEAPTLMVYVEEGSLHVHRRQLLCT